MSPAQRRGAFGTGDADQLLAHVGAQLDEAVRQWRASTDSAGEAQTVADFTAMLLARPDLAARLALAGIYRAARR